MPLKLMYVTNRPEVAHIAERAGVDLIFVDLEYIGKQARQGGMDTVQSHHTIEDVRRVRGAVSRAKVLVRVNPIHEAGYENGVPYTSSEEEISAAIRAGADALMLPYFKTAEEVRRFVRIVRGRAMTIPLLETPEAAAAADEILRIPGIDRIHIGLNDLSLGLHSGFMFGLFCDGTVDALARKCNASGMPFGIGGIAALGQGMLPAEYIIGEHYRLGSSAAILSRSFCNCEKVSYREAAKIFYKGIPAIRELEAELEERLAAGDLAYFSDNHRKVEASVALIQNRMKQKQAELSVV